MSKSSDFYYSHRYQRRLDYKLGRKHLYCAQCESDVTPVPVSGKVIYPRRKDLWDVEMFKCPHCGNYASESARVIPTPAIRRFRHKIHQIIDPLWRSGVVSRAWVYKEMSKRIGRNFHGGNIRSDEEAVTAYMAARQVAMEVSLRGLGASKKTRLNNAKYKQKDKYGKNIRRKTVRQRQSR